MKKNTKNKILFALLTYFILAISILLLAMTYKQVAESAKYNANGSFEFGVAQTIPTRTPDSNTIPTRTPTPDLTPSATLTPFPTIPPPVPFSVSINNGDLFTNDPNVTISLNAEHFWSEVKFSNDAAFNNEGWIPIQATESWTITTFGSYTLPRTVYVWFRQNSEIVFGPYSDDIIYDPLPPKGGVKVKPRNKRSQQTIPLLLTANDNESGVDAMRLASSESMNGSLTTGWIAFETSYSWPDTTDAVYVQFRDRAGNVSDIYSTVIDPPTSQNENIYLPLIAR